MRSLEGRSVVVTRARDQAEELHAMLSARGATPVSFPTIAIRATENFGPVDDAIQRLTEYDWVVFTSANAVRFFWDRWIVTGPAAWPESVRVAAVGPATARSVAARGIGVAAIPERHRGAQLPEVLGPLEARRLLLPRADIGREETLAALRHAGARVDPLTLYHTVPAAPDREGLAALRRGVDALTFASPSTVLNFRALLGEEADALVRGRLIVSIGPTTTEALRTASLPRPVEAARTTTMGIVAALEEHLTPIPIRGARDLS